MSPTKCEGGHIVFFIFFYFIFFFHNSIPIPIHTLYLYTPMNYNYVTVKILKIGTPEIITIIVLQLEQLDFTVQYCVQKMQTE